MRSELALFEEAGALPAPAPVHTAQPRCDRPRARRGRSSLTIVDLALAHDDLSGGMREYLAAKAEHARRSGAFTHHIVMPGRRERHIAGLHELPAIRRRIADGQRSPLRVRGLEETLRRTAPDVVLMHERRRAPRSLLRLTEDLGSTLVAVGHDGADESIPLRRGLHPAFNPGRHVAVRRHVLYAGRLAPSKGVSTLLEAASLAGGAWSLRVVGEGPQRDSLRRQAQRLALGRSVAFVPYVRDRVRLARYYAEASCVVAPGNAESFGLVALEAAACGTPVVCCSQAPVAALLGDLAETFDPGDGAGLAAAIGRARGRRRDPLAAARLAYEHAWDRVLDAELRDVERVAG